MISFTYTAVPPACKHLYLLVYPAYVFCITSCLCRRHSAFLYSSYYRMLDSVYYYGFGFNSCATPLSVCSPANVLFLGFSSVFSAVFSSVLHQHRSDITCNIYVHLDMPTQLQRRDIAITYLPTLCMTCHICLPVLLSSVCSTFLLNSDSTLFCRNVPFVALAVYSTCCNLLLLLLHPFT
jgi:hypothetical protein